MCIRHDPLTSSTPFFAVFLSREEDPEPDGSVDSGPPDSLNFEPPDPNPGPTCDNGIYFFFHFEQNLIQIK